MSFNKANKLLLANNFTEALDEYNNIIDTLITQTQINAANTHNNIVKFKS